MILIDKEYDVLHEATIMINSTPELREIESIWNKEFYNKRNTAIVRSLDQDLIDKLEKSISYRPPYYDIRNEDDKNSLLVSAYANNYSEDYIREIRTKELYKSFGFKPKLSSVKQSKLLGKMLNMKKVYMHADMDSVFNKAASATGIVNSLILLNPLAFARIIALQTINKALKDFGPNAITFMTTLKKGIIENPNSVEFNKIHGYRFKNINKVDSLRVMFSGHMIAAAPSARHLSSVLMHEIGHNFNHVRNQSKPSGLAGKALNQIQVVLMQVFTPVVFIITIINEMGYESSEENGFLQTIYSKLLGFLESITTILSKILKVMIVIGHIPLRLIGLLFSLILSFFTKIGNFISELTAEESERIEGFKEEVNSDIHSVIYGYGKEMAEVMSLFETIGYSKNKRNTFENVFGASILNSLIGNIEDMIRITLSKRGVHPPSRTRIEIAKEIVTQEVKKTTNKEAKKNLILQLEAIENTRNRNREMLEKNLSKENLKEILDFNEESLAKAKQYSSQLLSEASIPLKYRIAEDTADLSFLEGLETEEEIMLRESDIRKAFNDLTLDNCELHENLNFLKKIGVINKTFLETSKKFGNDKMFNELQELLV